ncbi:MAG: bifunctional transaldolase/phosoglucose isomerase [Thermoleophilaceae bacterium]
MSIAAEAGVNPRLKRITDLGTSIWLDQIRLNLIESGELERLVKYESLRGVTSNPAILEKAILGSDDYDELIAEDAEKGLDARTIYDHLAIKTVQDACDVLRPVWEESQGADGFVSIEVEPDLAFDTDKTLESARHYWKEVDRPNVMVKIPGTTEGEPAIEQATYDGINVNVTLLFSVEAYSRVADAYLRGLERRLAEGKDVSPQSVASFFVSRVDTEVDKRLEAIGRTDLQGTAAIANARAAYQHFKQIVQGERWQALADAGARVQRPLWASTGTKNPAYPETKYVDSLVGPHTVNTMPLQTLTAAGEKSEVTGVTVDQDPTQELEALHEAGIDLDDVTAKLLSDGVDLFIAPFEKLLAGIESAREATVLSRPKSVESSIPDDLEQKIAERVQEAESEQVARRIWHHDETLWGGPGPEIGNRLGWLTIADRMMDQTPALTEFVADCKADGLTDVVLCGMGGSSLAPEVIRRSFPKGEGGLNLHVLDSTDPGAIRAVEQQLDLEKTLFLVSSKSGGTIEPNSQYRYFRSKIDNGDNFVAITDPGSSLEELGKRDNFRRVFVNDPDIGGRYSALSYFGLVPAALMGVDVKALLDRARIAEENCTEFDSSASNRGLWMGLAFGEAARNGRDKLTYVVDEPIASYGLWAEQLFAESTGKEGKGILPVAGEPVGAPESYGDDRLFFHLRAPDGPDQLEAIRKAGHPVITAQFDGPEDLGRLFFFAEFAAAVAGWVLGINPFDQPNVQEAKDATDKVLAEGLEEPESGELDLSGVAPPHYIAIQGWVTPSEEFDAAIAELRTAIRDKTKATTTFGYGPRYLHSTGQFHKGGPPTGVFIQLVHDGGEDIEIPGASYTFGTLKNAQALGDFKTLQNHGLPVTRIRLEGDPAQAVRDLIGRL